jgi:hypothetical protein
MQKILIRTTMAALMVALATPAMAQFDVTGEWGQRRHEDAPERGPGPDLGDYAGLPVSAAAVQAADSWMASRLTLPEYQCRPHPADYSPRGPANLRFWETIDRNTQQLVSYHTHISWMAPERTIWMDGRPHPPAHAPHTWQGFSTGEWVGTSLKVTTTHLKTAFVRRNGVPRSDEAVMIEYWSRRGDVLTHTLILEDPVYLDEPLVRTTNWENNPDQSLDPYPCAYVVEVPEKQLGAVPHYLPGANPYLNEYAERFALPLEAVRGGSQTALPEFIRQFDTTATMFVEPEVDD